MRPVLIALSLAAAVSAAACSESRGEPAEADLRKAVQAYYERTGLNEGELDVDPDFVEPRSESRAESEQGGGDRGDGAGGGEAQGDGEKAERGDCPALEFTVRDGAGETRSRSVRVPCETIEQAQRELTESLDRMKRMLEGLSDSASQELGDLVFESVAAADKLACQRADGKPGYVCDVEVTRVYGDGREEIRFLTARFVKGEDGDWRALEVEEHR